MEDNCFLDWIFSISQHDTFGIPTGDPIEERRVNNFKVVSKESCKRKVR